MNDTPENNSPSEAMIHNVKWKAEIVINYDELIRKIGMSMQEMTEIGILKYFSVTFAAKLALFHI